MIFALDDGGITQMVLRPKAWPNFKGEIELILGKLCGLEWWRVVKEERAKSGEGRECKQQKNSPHC